MEPIFPTNCCRQGTSNSSPLTLRAEAQLRPRCQTDLTSSTNVPKFIAHETCTPRHNDTRDITTLLYEHQRGQHWRPLPEQTAPNPRLTRCHHQADTTPTAKPHSSPIDPLTIQSIPSQPPPHTMLESHPWRPNGVNQALRSVDSS